MKKYICAMLMAILLLSLCGFALAEGASEQHFNFATTDLDGNIVTSAEIYAGNKITLINFWATWCPPCVGELGELAEIHRQLREVGCGVVGILVDDDTEEAHALMQKNGTGYPVLNLSEDMVDLAETVTAIPTSYFVDGSGAIVGERIVGAFPEQYVPTVMALLETN